MADKKTELMAQFYQQCQEKGYTDMNDATQSLKAKVIATDMKLKYGEIVAFYDKAKLCYEEILAEKAASDEETKRRSVNGSLLVTLFDGSSNLKVYVRPDNTIYTVYADGEKEEGAPTFEVSKGGTLDYTYRPSKAVYTGATVGGITTGGVHYTKAGYEEKINKSNTGIVTVKTKNQVLSLKNAQLSDSMREAFKRDPQYREYAGESGRIVFSRSVSQSIVLSSISGGSSFHDMQSNLSHAIDASRMPYNHCVNGVNLLERVIRRQLPPSDERLYQRADSLAQSDSSESILNAAKQFEVISDYKDSAERAKELREKYELVLQVEKENAILCKEASQKKIKKTVIILIPSLIVVLIALVLSRSLFLSSKYKSAISMMGTDVVQAYESLITLGSYKDSIQQAESIYEQYKIEKLKVAQVGDYVFFGNYEQDNDTVNGSEKIEWLVLDKEDNKILVISRYGLDCAQYDRSKSAETWETSDIRRYLNDSFLNRAFSASEQAMILETTVSADRYPQFNTDPGNDTLDKVFLLSILEADEYFSSDDERKCLPTDYAVAQGVFIGHGYSSGGKATCTWWLRSPGDRQDYAARVFGNGNIDEGGAWFYDDGTIRPAIWINLG